MKTKKVVEIEVDGLVEKELTAYKKLVTKLTSDNASLVSKIKDLRDELEQYENIREFTQEYFDKLYQMKWIETGCNEDW